MTNATALPTLTMAYLVQQYSEEKRERNSGKGVPHSVGSERRLVTGERVAGGGFEQSPTRTSELTLLKQAATKYAMNLWPCVLTHIGVQPTLENFSQGWACC